MQFVVDCFIVVWHCVGGGGAGDPGGPHPAPEINAASSVAAIALLLSVGAIVYRRMQQTQ
ncbi:hypothetical protein RLW55_09845 [Hyphomicrobium sp. B1]|jgi:hypothetical protein|uniref:hypothetical protein n=1 Tax=unclassified Hyphomicrobium TaxID=2619925 RepID=UPI003919AFE6